MSAHNTEKDAGRLRDWAFIAAIVLGALGATALTCWAVSEGIWWLAGPLLAAGFVAVICEWLADDGPANVDDGERWA